MPRIFASLAVFALLSLLLTMWIGFEGDINDRFIEWKELQRQARQGDATTLDGGKAAAAAGDVQARTDVAETKLKRARQAGSLHIILGIISVVLVVLVCSIAVTYFIGTGRWCREVTEAYRMEPAILAESQSLKRGSFPWAVGGMLTALGISALGAASDPATGMEGTARWVTPHLFAALAGICLIGYCLYSLWASIVQNHHLVGRIMNEVRTRRAKAGLQACEGESAADAVKLGS